MTFREDWTVPRRARECAVSGAAFAPGDRVVSELFDRGDHFERRDRLESAEPDAGEAPPYSRWVSPWPPEPERAPGVDLDLARTFLKDLLREDEPAHRPLAHVLALLLIRKRRLKMIEHGLADDGSPVLRTTLPEDPDDVLDIPAPPMTPEVVAAVGGQVAFLFGFGPDPDAPEPDPEADGADDGTETPEDEDAGAR